MVQTRAGGLKAAEKNKKNYGDDFYRKIGSLGGRAKVPKGFALDRERARKAGAKGGRKSRRTGVTTGQGKIKEYYYNGDREFEMNKPKTEKEPEPKKRTFMDKVLGR